MRYPDIVPGALHDKIQHIVNVDSKEEDSYTVRTTG